MQSDVIQWFPGHMAKTRRLISENLKEVDIIIEILDARIPYSSKNPEIAKIVGDKPTLTILNKASLADKSATQKWIEYYEKQGKSAISVDCISGEGISLISSAVKRILSEKLQKYEAKGMSKKLRAMFVGIPNVGKSSLINKICGSKKAKVENRPGVTLNKQWVPTNIGFDLMDMPGVLWPKFEEKVVGENLAITGAIKDAILDTEYIAVILCSRLKNLAPDLFMTRYKINKDELDLCETDYDIFELVGRKRGFLISGGEINTERTAATLLEEFRSAKIGNITLEMPRED
ncbi:MAG: ribosome biogenesis GTPase YlqF [Clostridia bacterium]|nr:ribosome biogenesis GTPase YlqF [Clostridia bacterium]MBP3495308.1 ribosome biogenesis GTPase YlqF [Clostridia bacterium]MBQ7788241.1 ribosome biogenesis GTPase YlqF [Clostridia bacterium]